MFFNFDMAVAVGATLFWIVIALAGIAIGRDFIDRKYEGDDEDDKEKDDE